MFFLLGNESKEKKAKQQAAISSIEKVKELFRLGRFPVVTTQEFADRKIAKVLGLVACRGFDADEAFFGMAAMAQNKGGQAIIGYSENVAFHPDGSKFFSCFGTAVVFQRDSRDVRDSFEQYSEMPKQDQAAPLNMNTQHTNTQSTFSAQMEDDTEELLNLAVAEPQLDRVAEEDDPVLQKLLLQKQKSRQSRVPVQ